MNARPSATLTYDLRGPDGSSSGYYRRVRSFADEVVGLGMRRLGTVVRARCAWLRANEAEASANELEALVELLSLGTLWRVHGVREGEGRTLERSFASLDAAIEKLGATGEYVQEHRRLVSCRDFLASQSAPLTALAAIHGFAEWFERAGQEAIGAHTAGVEHFLREQLPRRAPRGDEAFCGRARVEYHFNLVLAELLNRAFRQSWEQAPRKALLLPACMRRPVGLCRAVAGRCAGCSRQCPVSSLTRLGESRGLEVRVLGHGSDYTRWAKGARPGTAVVGVACALNLLSGGWEAKAAGLPAQCVVLDRPGCSNHWPEAGCTTELDLGELERILGSSPARAAA